VPTIEDAGLPLAESPMETIPNALAADARD
jgi:hypothetical protein